MTGATAKPFAFDEFGASPPAPAPSFTADDIINAENNAREAALDAIIAQQARAQTDLLEKLSAQIEDARENFEQALSARQQSLRDISEAIVIKFCDGVASHRQGECALTLLDRYLNASPAQSPLKLRLPAETPETVLSALNDAISDRALSEFVEVAPSDDLKTGDCRIEWRGGAMARDMSRIKNEIRRIFAQEDDAEGANRDQQTRQP